MALNRAAVSSPDHAEDLLAHLRGTGEGKLLLLGHLDTVVSHEAHHPMRRGAMLLRGPGTIDMKGGVARPASPRGTPRKLAEVALLLVVDEEWRTAPFARRAVRRT